MNDGDIRYLPPEPRRWGTPPPWVPLVPIVLSTIALVCSTYALITKATQ